MAAYILSMGVSSGNRTPEPGRPDTVLSRLHGTTCTVFMRTVVICERLQLVNSCNDGARLMERTEQMYTIQKQMDFGKIKVSRRPGDRLMTA